MQTTKVFINGNSQAIRIPKEYRFDDDEVCICKVGSAVIVYQREDRLAVLTESLNEFTSDFLEDGRPTQSVPNERKSIE
ncbi:MAG: type II toxin-antitoxin system VapB family antitoxin [Oscillospiraceae bacterium]|nr:type II toxin-antitoxin system VapB family antitoxin [Oscillospiraceae bacterium]